MRGVNNMLQYVCDNCGKAMEWTDNENVVGIDFNYSESYLFKSCRCHYHLCTDCCKLFLDVLNKKSVSLRDLIQTPEWKGL